LACRYFRGRTADGVSDRAILDDLLALPDAVSSFNGFYTGSGKFILVNPVRIIIVLAVVAGLLLIALVLALVRYIRRRRRAHQRRYPLRVAV
jgi:uncharacterized membrane protein YdfJ with MMPL/SSD domain